MKFNGEIEISGITEIVIGANKFIRGNVGNRKMWFSGHVEKEMLSLTDENMMIHMKNYIADENVKVWVSGETINVRWIKVPTLTMVKIERPVFDNAPFKAYLNSLKSKEPITGTWDGRINWNCRL